MEAYEERQKERITTIISRENEARRILNLLIPMLQDRLKAYEGKQIYKINGCLMEKVKKELDPILKDFESSYSGETKPHLWLQEWSYNLVLNLDIRYSFREHFEYYKKEGYLCHVEKGVLTKITQTPAYTKLDLTEQTTQFFKVVEMKKALQAEEDKLFYPLRQVV